MTARKYLKMTLSALAIVVIFVGVFIGWNINHTYSLSDAYKKDNEPFARAADKYCSDKKMTVAMWEKTTFRNVHVLCGYAVNGTSSYLIKIDDEFEVYVK